MQRLLLSCLVVAALGCQRPAPPATTEGETVSQPIRLRLALNWFPEPEHGGYFAAREAWRERGLEVELLDGGPGVQVIARVASGDVDGGVDNADIVALGRAQGAPVVAVMAPLQDSPRCIMVHRSSGIDSLHELADLTLAMSPTGAFAELLQREVPLRGVEIVPYPGTVSRFLVEDRYAQQAYSFSEPVLARAAGADPLCLPLSELGWNPYTSTLIVSERTLADRPQVVRALVEGAVAGWRAYRADSAAADRVILERNPGLDAPTVAAMAADVMQLIDGREGAAVGAMTAERWSAVTETLESLGLTEPGAVLPEACYDDRYLEPAQD